MLAAFFRSTRSSSEPRPQRYPVDWDRLIRQASAECVLPALADRFRVLDSEFPIPPEVLQIATLAETLNAERNDQIVSEAIHSARLLNRIGVQPIALKGLAYLLLGVYPDTANRYLADIDFLIPSGELQLAARHLMKNGFFENNFDAFPEIRHHYPALRRRNGPNIELHHQLGLGICNRLLPVADLLAAASPISLDGATFLLPSPTHLVTHVILHSQLVHHPYHERVFPPLRALWDLERLQVRFGSQVDWLSIAEVFGSRGRAATLCLHLAQATDILGMPPPLRKPLGPFSKVRLLRRRFLNRHPWVRWIDLYYLMYSFFGRRLQLVPGILRSPSLWPRLCRRLANPDFYRNPFAR